MQRGDAPSFRARTRARRASTRSTRWRPSRAVAPEDVYAVGGGDAFDPSGDGPFL